MACDLSKIVHDIVVRNESIGCRKIPFDSHQNQTRFALDKQRFDKISMFNFKWKILPLCVSSVCLIPTVKAKS